MSSNLHRIVALVAVVMLGWFFVSQSGGQDRINEVLTPPAKEKTPLPDQTLVTIPNAVGAPRVQWEYKVMSQNLFNEQMANTWGIEGWELVTIYRQNDADVRSVFKRPKQFKLEK
jgi:hypothetical protein